jgi:D-alanyl-lipoteichoic acid acyltransferase DltB (MBOAT superfamily)
MGGDGVQLPVVALVHLLLGSPSAEGASKRRTGWLLAVSVAFYMSWNPLDTLLLAFVVGVAWAGGAFVHAAPDERRGPRLLLVACVLVAPLLYYKYTGFILDNIRVVWPAAPAPPDPHLPIGISFYTFQAMAYVIDVRRGQAPERGPIRFATFLLFFPHLVAGPILRAGALLDQLAAGRGATREDLGVGLSRLVTGLVKKVLIADVLRVGMVDSVFTDPGAFTGVEVLIALYAYTLQIYADFSGYSDFAIGSARMFGIVVPENFDRPYQALSVATYWRRWHMTLSDWVRDYVYWPMGGSKGGGWIPYRNTFVTLLILGVWHGANWTFVVYGLLHGCAVSLNRWWRKRQGRGGEEPSLGAVGVAWRWLATFHFVVLARILFRADDLEHAWAVTHALGDVALVAPRFSTHAWVVLVLGYAVHFTPTDWVPSLRARFAALPAPAWGVALAAAGAACVVWGAGDTLSFIYYEF